MNRRGFFRALAAVVVALPALPALLSRPIPWARGVLGRWVDPGPLHNHALARALREEAMRSSWLEHWTQDAPSGPLGDRIPFTRVKKPPAPGPEDFS